MERDEFYAVHCRNPKRVILKIFKVEGPDGTKTMTKTCPRIKTSVNFSVEAVGGIPVSVTCKNTSCPFHELYNKPDLPDDIAF